jgi:hypothetical protein
MKLKKIKNVKKGEFQLIRKHLEIILKSFNIILAIIDRYFT